MILFYIPFVYYYQTRIKTFYKLLSWVMIYLVPIYLTVCYFSQSEINIIYFFLLIVAVHNLYEIGYIQNDAETIKREREPTLRLTHEQLNYYYSHRLEIYLSRISLSFIISFWLFMYYSNAAIWLVWCIIPLFFLYNKIRSRLNLLLHFLLVFSRFCLPIYCITHNVKVMLLMILMFPLVNMIERMSEKRFEFNCVQKLISTRLDLFRVVYYFLITTILSVCYLFFNGFFELKFIIFVSAFFLVYRCVILFATILPHFKTR